MLNFQVPLDRKKIHGSSSNLVNSENQMIDLLRRVTWTNKTFLQANSSYYQSCFHTNDTKKKKKIKAVSLQICQEYP